MSVVEKCPFEVIETGGVIRLRLLDPAVIRRCSIEELFQCLRRFHPTTSDWVDDAGVLTAEFLERDLDQLIGINIMVSVVFTSRTRSNAWKGF